MVTPYTPGVEELNVHDAGEVALAVRATGAGQATVRPAGLTTVVSVTEPAKLNVLVRVTEMEAPVAPVLKFTGLTAEMEKSPTWLTKLAV